MPRAIMIAARPGVTITGYGAAGLGSAETLLLPTLWTLSTVHCLNLLLSER